MKNNRAIDLDSTDRLDHSILSDVEAELERVGQKFIVLSFCPLLEKLFLTQRHDAARGINRVTLLIFVAVFDFVGPTTLAAGPDAAWLSTILRFGIFTPLAFGFVALEFGRPAGRFYDGALATLAVLPVLINCALFPASTSEASLFAVQATLFLMLYGGLIARVPLPYSVAASSVSLLVFAIGIVVAPGVPGSALSLLLTTAAAIVVTMTAFSLRMEDRDRWLFLFHLSQQLKMRKLAAQNRTLAWVTSRDQLTGIGNRRRFDEALAEAWTDMFAGRAPVALILLDIDHFKPFNDFYGHQAGDDCLRAIVLAAQRTLRAGKDVIARYGGEEFGIVLPGTDIAGARATAEHIRQTVEDLALPHEGLRPGARVTISLGVAALQPGSLDTPAKLVATADRRLYSVKRTGRNRVCAEDAVSEAAGCELSGIELAGLEMAHMKAPANAFDGR